MSAQRSEYHVALQWHPTPEGNEEPSQPSAGHDDSTQQGTTMAQGPTHDADAHGDAAHSAAADAHDAATATVREQHDGDA